LLQDCSIDAIKLLLCSVAAVPAHHLEASVHLYLSHSSKDGCADVLKLLAFSKASPLAPQLETSHCVEWFAAVRAMEPCVHTFWCNLTNVSLL
jgi:hypothetical protein